jgi:hypothetical protein
MSRPVRASQATSSNNSRPAMRRRMCTVSHTIINTCVFKTNTPVQLLAFVVYAAFLSLLMQIFSRVILDRCDKRMTIRLPDRLRGYRNVPKITVQRLRSFDPQTLLERRPDDTQTDTTCLDLHDFENYSESKSNITLELCFDFFKRTIFLAHMCVAGYFAINILIMWFTYLSAS